MNYQRNLEAFEAQIAAQRASGMATDSAPRSDSRMCCDSGLAIGSSCPRAIATDTTAMPVQKSPFAPTSNSLSLPFIAPDAGDVSEAQFINSLFEGVSYGEGQKREQAYRMKKAELAQLERARTGGRRVRY